MKYYKFEKIIKGDNPIIRVTYKTWHGSLIEKDICKEPTIKGYWVFMEDGMLTHRFDPINVFYNGCNDIYRVNSSKLVK